jgi:hypothetical protein
VDDVVCSFEFNPTREFAPSVANFSSNTTLTGSSVVSASEVSNSSPSAATIVPAVPTRFTLVDEIVDAGRTLVIATVGARMITHFVEIPTASAVVHVVPPTEAVVTAGVRFTAALPVDVPVPPKFDIDPTCPGRVPVFASVRTAVNTPPDGAGIVVGATLHPHMQNSNCTPPTAVGVAVGPTELVPVEAKFFAHPRIAAPVAGTFRNTRQIAFVRFDVDVAIASVAAASVDATQFCL